MLKFDSVSFRIGERSILENISFQLEPQAIGCLIGPSGAGKTSILRLAAGFEQLNKGTITIAGQQVSSLKHHTNPEKRQVGFVFQDLALFPHLSIEKNIGFGLDKFSKAQRDRRVAELLELIGLEACRKRFPHQLSGGEKQRIALARAIAPKPKLILMDEAFSQLDPDRRSLLAQQIKCILREEKITALIVTHSQEEAFDLADTVGLVSDQQLMQWSSAYDLYHMPKTREVAHFVGYGSLMKIEFEPPAAISFCLGQLKTKGPHARPQGSQGEILVRPEDIVMGTPEGVEVEVVERRFRGASYIYVLKAPTHEIFYSSSSSHKVYQPGDRVKVQLQMEHVIYF